MRYTFNENWLTNYGDLEIWRYEDLVIVQIKLLQVDYLDWGEAAVCSHKRERQITKRLKIISSWSIYLEEFSFEKDTCRCILRPRCASCRPHSKTRLPKRMHQWHISASWSMWNEPTKRAMVCVVCIVFIAIANSNRIFPFLQEKPISRLKV